MTSRLGSRFLGVGLLLLSLSGCGADERAVEKRAEPILVDLMSRFAEARNWQERRRIDFGRYDARAAMSSGFSVDEREPGGRRFVWATGLEVEVRFAASEVRPTRMKVSIRPFRPEGRPPQSVSIAMNGETVDEFELFDRFSDYVFALPEYAMQRGTNTLSFSFDYAAPATEENADSSDSRRLAAAFDRLLLDRFEEAEPAYRDGEGVLVLPAGAAAVFEIPESEALAVDLLEMEIVGGRLAVDAIGADGRVEELGTFAAPSTRGRVELPAAEGGVRRIQLVASPAAPVRVGALQLRGGRARAKGEARTRSDARPDVVVYLVDTLRRDRIGAYGAERPLTPHIDAFAESAIRFDRAEAQAPWTKPAVASLFTGLTARRHGVNRFHGVLPEEAATLAEFLRAAGYETVAVSGSPPIRRLAGFAQGFETFIEVGSLEEGEWVPSPLVLDRVDEFLAAREDERPLFLYVHVTDPHSPYAPPPAFRRRFASAASRHWIPASHLSPPLRDEAMALYEAEVAYTDASFGRFLDSLGENDLRDEAVILFLADHGEQFHEHGGWRHNTNHAEVVRIPMILEPASSMGVDPVVVASPVRQIDVFPTLAALLELEAPEGLGGRDLGPLLRGELEESGDAPAALAYIWRSDRQDHSIVAHPWKLILSLRPEGGVERFLYDVADDPEERRNLARERPDVVARLEARLRAESVDVESIFPETERSPSERVGSELDAQLRALGYAD